MIHVLYYVFESERCMHGFHLGTDEGTAKRLTEEKWLRWHQGDGPLAALELEVNGKVVLRLDKDGWTRAPNEHPSHSPGLLGPGLHRPCSSASLD